MEKYITADEYKAEMGIDLSIELQDDDDPSNTINRFIRRRTDWCAEKLSLLTQNTDLVLNWDSIPENRQKWFRKGVMRQIEYILRGGLITLDTGYDADTHQIISLESIEFAPEAKDAFRWGGFYYIPCGVRKW